MQIEKFIKRRTFDVLLFGWISSLRHNLPGVTLDQAVSQFLAHFGLTEEEHSLDTAKRTYLRMVNELRELEKTQS
jgi:hypothetical protein